MLTEVSEREKEAFRSGAKAALELPVDKPRTVFIVAASVGLGLGAEMHAYGLNSGHTLGYKFLKDSDDTLFQTLGIIFESGIATSTLMALLLSVVWPDDHQQVKKTFQEFDTDGSGSIDATELKVAMRRLGLNMSDEDVQAMMQISDTDNSGEIELNEFENMIAAINAASSSGSASWTKIRTLLGGTDDGSTPAPRAATQTPAESLATVMACVEVNTWLIDQGMGEEAEAILRGFAEAGFEVSEWKQELQSMTQQELHALVSSARRANGRVGQSEHGRSGGGGRRGLRTPPPQRPRRPSEEVMVMDVPVTEEEMGAMGLEVEI
jgi:hypothetical protein